MSDLQNGFTLDRFSRGKKTGYVIKDKTGAQVIIPDGGKVRAIIGVTDHLENVGKEAIDYLMGGLANKKNVECLAIDLSQYPNISSAILANKA